ncbi:MAG: threonine/serine dehydratase [Alphaproteobacteria bacterium]
MTSSSTDIVNRDTIMMAGARIGPHIRRTPFMEIQAGDLLPDRPVVLKLEYMQHSGSFKARGAFNAMLSRPVPEAGVIAASGGNHGAAVAFAARKLGHNAEIFVPELASKAKIRRLEAYGATVNVIGSVFAEALEACIARQQETGALFLHPYDQPEILNGQGTVALDFTAQIPSVDTIMVSVGGGGLIGGMAAWCRGEFRLIGVEPETCNALDAAMAAGQPVDVAVSGCAADSLGAKQVGSLMYPYAEAYVDNVVTVPEEAIVEAQKLLWDRLRIAVETGAATTLAGLLSGAYQPPPDAKVGVVLCGANLEPASVA